MARRHGAAWDLLLVHQSLALVLGSDKQLITMSLAVSVVKVKINGRM